MVQQHNYTLSEEQVKRIAAVCFPQHSPISRESKLLLPYPGDGSAIPALMALLPKLQNIQCFAVKPQNENIGKIKGARPIFADFVSSVEGDKVNLFRGVYDAVVGIPPIETEIEAVRIMYDACKANGRVVAVVSDTWCISTAQRHADFRAWLDGLQAFQEPFTGSSEPDQEERILIVIDKLEAANADFGGSKMFIPGGLTTMPVEAVAVPEDEGGTVAGTIAAAAAVTVSGGRVCKVCGCHELDACCHPEHGNCHWVDEYLCSHCQDYPGEAKRYSVLSAEAAEKKKEEDKAKPKAKPRNLPKRITIPADPLIALLRKAADVAMKKVNDKIETKNPTLRVLSNVLIDVRKKDIQVIASDLIVTIIGTIEVTNDGDTDYQFLLPFDYLYKICELIPSMALTIEVKTETKKIDGKNREVQNAILTTFLDTFNQDQLESASDWPKLPEFPRENSVGISGDFIEWLNKATASVAKENAPSAMQKILVSITQDLLTIASTNAKLLLEKTFASEASSAIDMLVSTKIANALKGFKETSISWSSTHIAFVAAGITMIGTIQDEKFPNYKGLFPPETPANLTLPRAELVAVMEKASLTSKPATFYLKREIGSVTIESTDPTTGRKITVKIPTDYKGDCEAIMVDPKYMLLLLKQISYTTISLTIQSHKSPIIITTESDTSYRSLIMPLTTESK